MYIYTSLKVENLKKETELRAKEKGELESRKSEAENKVLELSLKLKSVSSFSLDGEMKFIVNAEILIICAFFWTWYYCT